jgi:hypothetical protein
MIIERFIFIAITVISITSIIYIRKEAIRLALLSFISFQTTTWFTSIMLAERGKALYPVREFVKAASVNFIPQFIFYPTIFMWFILIFPKERSVLVKIIHYIGFVSLMVWFIYFTARFTEIYEFPNSTDLSLLLLQYIRNTFQFILCHLYITWFFKSEQPLKGV